MLLTAAVRITLLDLDLYDPGTTFSRFLNIVADAPLSKQSGEDSGVSFLTANPPDYYFQTFVVFFLLFIS